MAKKTVKAAVTGMSIDRSKLDYQKTKAVDPTTNRLVHTFDNGDAVAQALMRAKFMGIDTAKIAKGAKLEAKGANAGQIRMNLGNMLRARVRKGEAMQIGDQLVKKIDQKVPMPDGVKAADVRVKERAKLGEQKAKAAIKSRGSTARSASRTKGSGSQTAGSASTSPTA